MENRPASATRADWAALLCAVVLFGWLVGFVSACGTEDLTFPGDFPATGTADPTDTPAP